MGALPPYGSTPHGVGDGATPPKNEQEAFYDMFQNFLNEPDVSAGIKAMVTFMMHQLPPNPDDATVSQIETVIQGVLENPVDPFMKFGLAPNDPIVFQGSIAATTMGFDKWEPSWSHTSPTFADTLYQQILNPQYQSQGIDALSRNLAQQLLSVGSGYTQADVKTWLDGQFTSSNFPTEYPSMGGSTAFSDLEDLAHKAGYTLPTATPPAISLAQSFLSAVAYLQSIGSGTGDYALFTQIVADIQSGWVANDPSAFNTFVNAAYNNAFADFFSLSEAGAIAMERLMPSLTVPAIQHEFFQIRALALGPPPLTGHDLEFIQTMTTQIQSQFWPGGTAVQLILWFGQTYDSGYEDCYMQFYNVSVPVLEAFTTILSPSMPIFGTPTPMDILFRQAMPVMLNLAPNSPDMNLFTQLFQQIQKAGGCAGQVSQVEAWAQNIALSIPSQYPPIGNTTTWSFLTLFPYNSQVIPHFLMGLEIVPGQPAYIIDLAVTMRSIFSAFLLTNPTGSSSDFQTFLNQNYASRNLCNQIPGVTPLDVNYFFNMMNVRSPYVYTPIDDALAVANLAYVAGDGNSAILNTLIQMIHNYMSNPTEYPYSGIVAWIKQQNPADSVTQDILQTFLDITPPQ